MTSERIVRELQGVVGGDNVLWRKADLQTYEYDAYLEKAMPEVVVLVDSADQISAVVKIANRERIPFVPRGRGTNLSGGVLAVKQGIVIELARMDRILEIDIPNERMIVEPGVYNQTVSDVLAPLGYCYVPDPASGKACSIGGNVAENAGGPHCFKYGVTSNYVLGLEVVLPDGEITWLGGKALDLPGLDLVGAFVGSEGTFGICTKAILRIMRSPEAVKTMLAVYDSMDDASNTVSAIVAKGMILATLEMMDNLTIQAVEDSVAAGYPRDAAAVLLLELDGIEDGMNEMAQEILAICKANNVREVRVAASGSERAALWRGRKGAFGAVARLAPNYLVADGTVPRTQLPATLRKVMEIGDKYGLKIANVFHAGDGNLHPLVLFDSRVSADRLRVMKAGMDIMQACVEAGGTISGEHGVGIEKTEAMKMIFSERELQVQEWVKEAFDPDDLCNPGKILPSRVASSDVVRAV